MYTRKHMQTKPACRWLFDTVFASVWTLTSSFRHCVNSQKTSEIHVQCSSILWIQYLNNLTVFGRSGWLDLSTLQLPFAFTLQRLHRTISKQIPSEEWWVTHQCAHRSVQNADAKAARRPRSPQCLPPLQGRPHVKFMACWHKVWSFKSPECVRLNIFVKNVVCMKSYMQELINDASSHILQCDQSLWIL